MGRQNNSIFEGDCISGLRQLTPGSVDLAFADPPFNIGYDYDIYHDRRAAEEYLDWTRQWMAGVKAALKPTGAFWLAIGDEFAAELKVIAQKDLGFTCRSWVIWYYTFGVNCTRAFSRSHTHLFYFVCDPNQFTFNSDNPAVRVPSARQLVYGDGRANPRGRLPDNTWILRPQDIPNGFAPDHDTWYYPRVAGTFKEREGFHGCQMPEQLLGRIIRCSSNPMEIVLDPFGGSGTTFAVAKKLGRQWIGFELSKDYARRIRQRLEKTRVGDPLDGSADPLSSAPATTAQRGPKAPNAPQRPRRLKKPDGESTREIMPGLIDAFKTAHGGFSVDHVLADASLNAALVEACKRKGLPGDAAAWNLALLRIRKAGKLPRAAAHAKTYTFAQMDAYTFAAEVAMQQLSVEFQTTLDGILCQPSLAARFDALAETFSPGYTSFQYRWAALALRKRAKTAKKAAEGRFQEWLKRALPRGKPFQAGDWTEPAGPGVYILGDRQRHWLYVGETLDLAKRLELLTQIPAWQELDPASVRVIPESRTPYGLQSVLIRRLNPLMNWRLLSPEFAE